MAAPESSLASSSLVSRLTRSRAAPARAASRSPASRAVRMPCTASRSPRRASSVESAPASPSRAAPRGSLPSVRCSAAAPIAETATTSASPAAPSASSARAPSARQRVRAAESRLPMPTTGCRRAGGSPRAASIASAAAPTSERCSTGVEHTLHPMAEMTWIGHGTALIEVDGVRLLTDPLLRTRVAHLQRHAPLPPAAALARIDAVLLTHLHRDHLDLPSLRRIGRAVPLVVPRGGGRLLLRRGFDAVREIAPGEEIAVGRLTVSATEARHHGGRSVLGAHGPALGYLV